MTLLTLKKLLPTYFLSKENNYPNFNNLLKFLKSFIISVLVIIIIIINIIEESIILIRGKFYGQIESDYYWWKVSNRGQC
jgi:hypothetical protein